MIWNTRESHSIFKFKYNNYKHVRRPGRPTCFYNKNMFLLVGRLLQSDRTKALVKYLASSSFKYYSVQETRKLLTLFKAHFFIDHSLRIFNKVFAFVDCTRLVIKTPILSDKLRQRFLLTDQKL